MAAPNHRHRVSFALTTTGDSTVNRIRCITFAVTVLLALAGMAERGEAQMRVPQWLTLGGGYSKHNFYGTRGNSPVFMGRLDGFAGSYAIIEAGVAFTSYTTQFGRTYYLLPEISLQGQVYLGPVHPFLGGGIGFANITHGPNLSKLTLHAASGARIVLGGGWGVLLETRERAIDPWQSHTLDFTAGLMRVLPSSF